MMAGYAAQVDSGDYTGAPGLLAGERQRSRDPAERAGVGRAISDETA